MSTLKLVIAVAAGATLVVGASIAANADGGRGGGRGPWNYDGWYPGCCAWGYAAPYAYYPQPYTYSQQYYYPAPTYAYPAPTYAYPAPAYGYVTP